MQDISCLGRHIREQAMYPMREVSDSINFLATLALYQNYGFIIRTRDLYRFI